MEIGYLWNICLNASMITITINEKSFNNFEGVFEIMRTFFK